jgi:hypothetical protein
MMTQKYAKLAPGSVAHEAAEVLDQLATVCQKHVSCLRDIRFLRDQSCVSSLSEKRGPSCRRNEGGTGSRLSEKRVA